MAPAPAAASPSSNGVSSTAASSRTITVIGTGSVTATPDIAIATVGVTMTGASTADAVNSARSASDKLAAALVAAGVSRDDMATTQYSVGQHWNPQTQRNEGWEVRDGLTIVIRDVARTGTVIAGAAAALPNVFWVGDVHFDRAGTADILGAARDAAMKDARARAAGWAHLTNAQLGDVVSVSEESAAPAYALPSGAGGQGGGGGFQTGTGRLTVTVTVVYAIR
jgi:uncharacterized protein YggE